MKDNTRLFIKLIFLTIAILGSVYIIMLAKYTFNGHGDIRNEVGRQVIKSFPETSRIAITAVIFLIYGTIVYFISYMHFRHQNQDLTAEDRIIYEKKTNKLEYNLSLREKRIVELLEKVGVLTDQLSKSEKKYKKYKVFVNSKLLKQAKIHEEILYFEGD